MYILYSADIINYVKHFKIHLHADDVQPYLSCRPDEMESGVEKISEDLANICNWSCRNRLKLNPEKSKFKIIDLVAKAFFYSLVVRLNVSRR